MFASTEISDSTMRKVMEIADEPVIVKSSRLKSDVWNDFDRVKKDDTFIAICRHCNRKLNGSSTSGTSHLRNHLLRCRRRTNYDTSQLLTRGKNKDKMFAAANCTFDQEQRKAEAFSIVRTKLEHGPLKDGINSRNWDRVSALTTFVKHFHEVSGIFRGNKCNTANIYFPEICNIHLQLIEWCQNSDDFIHSLALKMKSRFDEYWKKCSLALAIAAILDPRFKLKLVEYYYPQIYGDESKKCIDTVSDCMKALYTGHAIYSPLASHGSCDGSLVGTDSRDRLKGFDHAKASSGSAIFALH
nr:zinc finger BED domain-containing protein RICESLEEPER 1-like [Ipomoea batatas]